jgi:hypothetical protein
LQQFPFVGHSLGLLSLIWSVNLVLKTISAPALI